MGTSMWEMDEMFSKKDLTVGEAREYIAHSESACGRPAALAKSMKNYTSMKVDANFKCGCHGTFTASPMLVAKRGCPFCAASMWAKHIGTTIDDNTHPEEAKWITDYILPIKSGGKCMKTEKTGTVFVDMPKGV